MFVFSVEKKRRLITYAQRTPSLVGLCQVLSLNTSFNPNVQYCSLITDVEYELKRFWEIEEIELPKTRHVEYDLTERHFTENLAT